MRNPIPATLTTLILLSLTTLAAPPATTSTTDAAPLYLRAATLLRLPSPIETALDVPDRPPYPPEWTRLAKSAYEANRPALDLVRQARACTSATWPNDPDYAYFSPLRRLVNQLRDAALYEHAQGHPAAALELFRDGLHLADLVKGHPARDLTRLLTASSLQGIAVNHLRLLAATAPIVPGDPHPDRHDLPARTARALITTLLDQQDPEAHLTDIFGPPGPRWIDESWNPDRATQTLTRANADRTYPALLLACRLYHLDHHRWPVSLEELTPTYLPKTPITSRPDTRRAFIQALRTLTRDAL